MTDISSASSGTLYIVATPIGNLDDMSPRAMQTLQSVTLILAEDTRHSAKLLRHFAVTMPVKSYHEHNESERCGGIIAYLQSGHAVALISDAGTPLVSDPGFRLVRAARAAGIKVVPVPGACAAVAGLSAAGLPSDRFYFCGFPARKSGERRRQFEALRSFPDTLIFYESPHRLEASLADMQAVFGTERRAVLAKEISKLHETICDGGLEELLAWLRRDPQRLRGEFVILVGGCEDAAVETTQSLSSQAVLQTLLTEIPLKQAVALTAKITGCKRNVLYKQALKNIPDNR